MKHLIYFIFLFLAISCRNDFDFESAHKTYKQEEYTSAFAEEFGYYGAINIDENHKWGFSDFQYDSIPVTRSHNANSNMWDQYNLDVPVPLTKTQKDVVTKWFTETKNPTGIAVNWTDYFAQHVSSTKYGKTMDYLLDAGTKGNDHINNFNSGTGTSINVNGKWNDEIMYMYNQSTKDFAYHESVSERTWYDHYVIIPGEMIDPMNTYGLHGMYFVGFDYEAQKKNGDTSNDVKRDYYFNDWIIKITPGLIKEDKMQRIMAEDLGEIGDFDFNDVVFDCYIQYNPWYTVDNYGLIVLRAAGGTMPLYVNGEEVHEKFGVDVTTMVNTGNGLAVERPIVIWRFIPTSANAVDIPIHVENTKEKSDYFVKSEIGKAPGKFAVPVNVKWSEETISIKTTYPKFPMWVEDQSKYFWK